jgi:hypothetical protein
MKKQRKQGLSPAAGRVKNQETQSPGSRSMDEVDYFGGRICGVLGGIDIAVSIVGADSMERLASPT